MDNPGNTNDKKISQINAEEIYDEYIKNGYPEYVISIQGTFGSGKTTTKNQLLDLIAKNDKQNIVVDYVAIQYEEPSQITSQFYREIGKKLDWCNKFLFNACAVLKKENQQSPFISGNLSIFAFIVGIITLIYSLNHKNIESFIGTSILNILLAAILIGILVFKNDLLIFLSSLIPQYSHIEIITKKLNVESLKNKPIYIFIDEMDRISANSLKLLFDEISNLNHCFNKYDKTEIKHKFFLFYNPEIVKQNLSSLGIDDVDFYLQKYMHATHKILKPDLHHALHLKLFNCRQNIKIQSTEINNEGQNQHI